MRKLMTIALCAASMLMFAGCCCKSKCAPAKECPKAAKQCPKAAAKKAAKKECKQAPAKAAQKAAAKGAKKVK